MSTLKNAYANITNNGVEAETVISDKEYKVVGRTEVLLTAILNGGSAIISVDNGSGYTTGEVITDGATNYKLGQCRFKITLSGGAVASIS